MQGLQQFFHGLYEFTHFVWIYYTTILGFCMFISVIVMGLIMVLRSVLFSKSIFGKVALWTLIIPCLFCGKLRLFFENKIGVKLFFWWYNACVNWQIICVIYILVGVVIATWFIHRRIKLKKLVIKLDSYDEVESKYEIKQFPSEISSFCSGCMKPIIVVPSGITKEQAQTIIKHEETHIMLGHLWIQLVWEVIRILLWPNILLHISEKYLKRDLEDICDSVTIQRYGIDSIHYGKVLLENAKRLAGSGEISGAASGMSFSWDDSYEALRKRIVRITHHRIYNRKLLITGSVYTLIMLITVIIGIKSISYGKYNTMDQAAIFSVDRMDVVAFDVDSSIVTSYDDEYIYIDCAQLKRQYPQVVNDVNDIYFSVGGYYKIPGMGGGSDIGFLSPETIRENDGIIKTEKYSGIDGWNRIIMWL